MDGLQPKAAADYLFSVQFAYENGKTLTYVAQTVTGTDMKLVGRFKNDNLAIAAVPPMPSRCNLVLVGKMIADDAGGGGGAP